MHLRGPHRGVPEFAGRAKMSGRIQRDAQFPKRGPGELARLVAATNRAQAPTAQGQNLLSVASRAGALGFSEGAEELAFRHARSQLYWLCQQRLPSISW